MVSPFLDFFTALDGVPPPGRVFPCIPGGKAPLTANGHHDASNDMAQLRTWAEAHPDANVGLDPESMGLGVVDIDGEAGEQAWSTWQVEHGLIPETYGVRTPHGRHQYFRGVLPTTSGKLAPHVDTRGSGSGYVLIPPSVTPDGAYAHLGQFPLVDAPSFLLASLETPKHVPAKAPAGLELDTPANVARAARFLKDRAPAIEGQGGDAHTVKTAAVVRDLGVSEERAVELMQADWNERCKPPWEPGELAEKIGNAYRYAQNEAGCHAVGPNPPEWEEIAAEEARQAPRLTFKEPDQLTDWEQRVSRFRGRCILEYRDLPPLEYWDADNVLPKMKGGAAGMLFAPSGAGKTTLILALIGEAILTGAKVLFCAGEGAYGVGKQRLPALAECLGITLEALSDKLRLVDQAVNLLDAEDVAALIAGNAEFNPDIVVIDTLAASTPGANENEAATASLMTGGGAVGRIKGQFNATVVVLHHSGKDESKGARGSSGFEGNSDFFLQLAADKEAGTARLKVRKMRDGPDGFSVYFRVTPATNGVPVARKIAEADYKALSSTSLSVHRHEVAKALRPLKDPISTHVLAMMLVPAVEGQEPDKYDTLVSNEERNLRRLAKASKDGRPGPLEGYVARDHRGEALKPLMWAVPASDDDGGDDE
jgi:hypothetical protein